MKLLIRDAKSIGIGRAISCAVVSSYYNHKGKVADIKAKVKCAIRECDVYEKEDEE